jgi:hypothetical protein
MFLASCQKLQASSLRSPEISRGTARMDYDRNLPIQDECWRQCQTVSRSGPSNSAAESTDPGDVATNGESVDIMGAFVGGNRLKVHQMSDHRITIGDAHGAE